MFRTWASVELLVDVARCRCRRSLCSRTEAGKPRFRCPRGSCRPVTPPTASVGRCEYLPGRSSPCREHGLFGYPNLVSNPADDEQELVQRRGVSLPEAHRIRWPGNWLIEDKEGTFSVRLVAREDQEANPAILKAQEVLQAAGIPACISTPDPSDPAKGSRFYH